jgi:GH24 family phage-related lysozyme (muramidase)
MFNSISKLRFIFGIEAPTPTVLNVNPISEPSTGKKPSAAPPCFKLSPYWKSVLAFWEGYRPYRYRDSEGYWTVGIGTLIDTDRVSLSRIQNRLGQHFASVMDGIESDPDPVAGTPGSRNGNSPMPGTQQSPVSVDLAWQWAESDVQKAFTAAFNFIGPESWARLPYPVQCVLVSLSYQANITGFIKLKKALTKNPPDYNEAANQMMRSTWYNQTQSDRKEPMIAIMRSGGSYIPTKIGKFTPSNPETARTNPCGVSNPATNPPQSPTTKPPHPWSPGYHWWE